MGDKREVSDFDELRRLRLSDEGYFVITDGAGHAAVHKVNAKCITSENFNAKVRLSERKAGGYFWVDSIATAAKEFGAKRCRICKPELHRVDSSTFER